MPPCRYRGTSSVVRDTTVSARSSTDARLNKLASDRRVPYHAPATVVQSSVTAFRHLAPTSDNVVLDCAWAQRTVLGCVELSGFDPISNVYNSHNSKTFIFSNNNIILF